MKQLIFWLLVFASTAFADDDQLLQQALKEGALARTGKLDVLRFVNYSSRTQLKLNAKANKTTTVNGQPLSANVVVSTITGNAGTSTALAANGANCSAGQAALGVDASGASEGCFTPAGTYAHPTGDGNLHVPATSTTNSGKVLTAGATAGSLSWATPTVGTVTGVTGTAPVVSSGGAAPVISMAAATGSVPGYLTAANWTTFNAKEPPITAGTSVQYWRGDKTWQSLGTATAWTPTLNSFTTSGVVILTGWYVKVGALVTYACKLDGYTNGATITSTGGASYVSGLPVAAGAYFAVASVTDSSGAFIGNGIVSASDIVPPSFTRTGANIYISGSYLTY